MSQRRTSQPRFSAIQGLSELATKTCSTEQRYRLSIHWQIVHWLWLTYFIPHATTGRSEVDWVFVRRRFDYWISTSRKKELGIFETE